MSIVNFIPEIWSDNLKEKLYTASVMAARCTTQWSGAIANVGDTVNIINVVSVTTIPYAPGTPLVYGDLSDEVTQLVVDQADVFSFKVDDIDKRQSIPGLVEQATESGGKKLADDVDNYIFSLVDASGEVGSTVDATSATGAYGAFDAASAGDYISAVSVAFDEKNVPQDGRWGVISPRTYAVIKRAKIGEVQSESTFDTGELIEIDGIRLYKSNNVPNTTLDTGIKNVFGQGPAIAFANQLTVVEAIRLADSFADGVRGLNVYGAKVVSKDLLVLMNTDLVEAVEE